ncbi:hypothetical protein [Rhizobium sp. AN73]|uniref:hypothetical protein n=1 Tax=Rhizobium sp. AN73 TaxID=3035124 RepID=UPI0027420A62|nr:hypothetical protein [Rhizobium sp. AN73]
MKEIIGISVEELGLFFECDTGEDALTKLEGGRHSPARSADTYPGGDRLVIVAGETIAVAEEPCMLFTFADLDGRRKGSPERSATKRGTLLQVLPPVPCPGSDFEARRLRIYGSQ